MQGATRALPAGLWSVGGRAHLAARLATALAVPVHRGTGDRKGRLAGVRDLFQGCVACALEMGAEEAPEDEA